MKNWIVTLEVTIEAGNRQDALEKVAKIVNEDERFLFTNVYDAEIDPELVQDAPQIR